MATNGWNKTGIEGKAWRSILFVITTLYISVCLLTSACSAQRMIETAAEPAIAPAVAPAIAPAAVENKQLLVSWAYGAYVPKDVPLLPMTPDNRRRLFERQSYTTPGIYLKSGFLGLLDQAKGDPAEWGGGMQGYGQRVASRYGQILVQNSLSSVGNALLQYDPRYDRCRCSGLWPRTRHAFLRNFVTYNRTEQELRPQFALYGAAFGAGMISSTWKPRAEVWEQGAHGVLTQALFGLLTNWVGEFSPEISRVLHGRSIHRPEN